jgi:hypothetical protein
MNSRSAPNASEPVTRVNNGEDQGFSPLITLQLVVGEEISNIGKDWLERKEWVVVLLRLLSGMNLHIFSLLRGIRGLL